MLIICLQIGRLSCWWFCWLLWHLWWLRRRWTLFDRQCAMHCIALDVLFASNQISWMNLYNEQLKGLSAQYQSSDRCNFWQLKWNVFTKQLRMHRQTRSTTNNLFASIVCERRQDGIFHGVIASLAVAAATYGPSHVMDQRSDFGMAASLVPAHVVSLNISIKTKLWILLAQWSSSHHHSSVFGIFTAVVVHVVRMIAKLQYMIIVVRSTAAPLCIWCGRATFSLFCHFMLQWAGMKLRRRAL